MFRQSVFVVPLVALLASCSGPSQATKDDGSVPASRPALASSIRIASIDLFSLKRRIEKKDIDRFAEVVKREQIEILAVQGITRYPNVKTRVDFVDEFSARADMRRAFGESIDMSGQQRVNAVFSIYPIQWSNKKEFDVPSAFYETALQVSIDAGVRDVMIVSSRVPEKAAGKDLSACIETILGLRSKGDMPFIATGNLPVVRTIKGAEMLSDVRSALPAEGANLAISQVWHSEGDLFKLLAARTVKTELGTMTVSEFGLYQPSASR